MTKRYCIVCGKEFMPKVGSHLICSRECRNKRRNSNAAARRGENIAAGIMAGVPDKKTEKGRLLACLSEVCKRMWTLRRENAALREEAQRARAREMKAIETLSTLKNILAGIPGLDLPEEQKKN